MIPDRSILTAAMEKRRADQVAEAGIYEPKPKASIWCIAPDCEKRAKVGALCWAHYHRRWRARRAARGHG